MKYIDNLLDWGDALFAQFTMESVNETTMLYIMAADILGPRPADVGDCGEGKITPKTYAQIAPGMKKGQDFLIELEALEISQKTPFTGVKYTIDTDRAIGVRYQAISAPMSPIPSMNSERIGDPCQSLMVKGSMDICHWLQRRVIMGLPNRLNGRRSAPRIGLEPEARR